MSDCTHHWQIPSPPAEPVGVCRHCGATRQFRNSFPDITEWERTHPFARPRQELEPAPVNDVDRAFRRWPR